MPIQSVAATIIAKNEEENLPRLFDSLYGAVDKIYLTDTGSTDKTVEVAKKLGAEVSHFTWVDDFSEARNFNLSQCQEEFALFIDCDDILDNKEGFIQFKKHVMDLYDYHLAPYHYSLDAQGKPLCSFARERVFRMSKGFRWKYFVHEGVMPVSPYGDVKVNYAGTWSIKHLRTEADLNKDRSRNLNLFKKREDKLNARMRYYYAKELFENKNPLESISHFLKAVSDPELELHDRILGLQYLCYAYIQCNQFMDAMGRAHDGLILAPNRAEFHNIIGDCYLKLGQVENAIPFFSAAKKCKMDHFNGYAPALFHHEDAYTVYPRNQLARIYTNIGNLEEGEKEALSTLEQYKNAESELIHKEIVRIKSTLFGFKNAKPCDDIVITTPPQNAYVWDAELYKSKGMGGSETAAIEVAYWLKKLSGRNVKIFNMRDKDIRIDGVDYISNTKVHDYMNEFKPFLHIAWRHNIKITDAPTFLWCHDLVVPGHQLVGQINKVLCLTPFHKAFVMANQGIPDHKIYVTRNGINPERFKDGPWKKNPKKIVFPSSPDRGLDRTMRILDRVREVYPDLELDVFYGIEHLSKYGLGELEKKLKSMMDERPWVHYHGNTEQKELMRHFKEAVLWIHPADFIETSCITAMEMLACGVYPVTRRLGGLQDTLKEASENGMATLLDHDCVTESQYEAYAQAAISAIREKAWERVNIDVDQISWEKVALGWLNDLPKLAYPGDSLKTP